MDKDDQEPIHGWFGLSYCNYQVLPRTLLQSAPLETQRRAVALFEELAAMFADVPQPYQYNVHAADAKGHFIKDPVPHYERGRARVQAKVSVEKTQTAGHVGA